MNTEKKFRRCVFCGLNPVDKDKEHVIPEWLIEYTGDPSRVVTFGVSFRSGQEISFAFDQFTAPSCSECNSRYSGFEDEVKHILLKIESHELLTANEGYKLLDWFDKVRIGLWLQHLMIQKNPLGITPKFHIDDRIGMHDRYLAIYFTDSKKKGLSFYGPENIIYHSFPSCLCLRLNSILFVSISREFLLSKRAGFPYPINTIQEKTGYIRFSSMRTNNDILLPLIPKLTCLPSLAFGQTIFESGYLNFAHDSYLSKFELIRDTQKDSFCQAYKWINFGANLSVQSKIFQEHLSHLFVLDNEDIMQKTLTGNPAHSRTQGEIIAQVYKILDYYLDQAVKQKYEDIRTKMFMKNLHNTNKDYTRALIKHFEEGE